MSIDAVQAPRSWWLAWLAGAAVPFVLGIAAMTTLLQPIFTRAGLPLSVSGHAGFIRDVLPVAAIIALPTAAFLVAIMAWAERRIPRPLWMWLIAGLIATSPVALFAWGTVEANARSYVEPPREVTLLPIPLFFYACGLIGAATARRVRHRSWR